MFARLFRCLIAFGVVVVAYQAYALLLVPIIEPGGTIAASRSAAPFDPDVSNPVEKYQRLLSAYFPTDHWTQTGKPKVIESGQLMLVIDDYQRDNRGRVDLKHCAVVVFPTPRTRGAPAPRDAVIIEAPGLVKLQFDKEFNPSRGRIGRITEGQFVGEITIRSDMRDPGPADDLLIRTRNLQMNESRIYTGSDIAFRLGGHRGRGRRMDIILLKDEHRRPGEGAMDFNGVSHLEIHHVEHLELQLGKLKLGGPAAAATTGADAWAAGAAPRDAPAAAGQTPVEVSCDGPFLLSFLDFTATFRDNVVATQLNLSGQSDQLTCQELRVRFGDAAASLSPREVPDMAEQQRDAMDHLRPRALEAVGEPVIVQSPSRDAMARCRYLRIEIPTRTLNLSGGVPELRYGASRVSAPVIRYQHPTEASREAIGRLWLAGPGEIRVAPQADRPQDAFNARWNAAPGIEHPVQLTRVGGQPVLMVEGRPQISGSRLGRLTSDRLRFVLRETPPDGPDGPAIELAASNPNARAILAERIEAIGAVRIESPELDARTSELVVHVKPKDRSPELGDPRGGGAGLRSEPRPDNSQRSYLLGSQKIQMDLLTDGRRATPANLVCLGRVEFSEAPTSSGHSSGFAVRGERLTVANLESGSVDVRVDGAVNASATDAALAQILAKGLTLRAATVRLDQASNRLWADGAGNARITATRDLFGQATHAATDLHLRWRGGLNFDGRRITVRDDVYGEGPHDWVRCREVTATLDRAVNFSHGGGGDAIEIAQLDCRGGVTIDHRTVDQQGQRSHERARVESLTINRKTGAITGQGPGDIRSVRLGGGGLVSLAPGAPAAADRAEGLQFLRVHFLRGLSGDLNKRELSFLGDVRCVYGPVLAWEKELALNSPVAPEADTATLSCDRLTVNEDPLVGMTGQPHPQQEGLGPLELHARGNVVLQGAAEGKGIFTAYASSTSYSQSKEEVVLEGDNRSPATLYQQDRPGDPRRASQAQKLTYWPATGRVKIDNFQHGGARSTPATARPAWPAAGPR